MDEVQETALAYYEKLPEPKKQKAQKFFDSLDKNGDGKIQLEAYIAELERLGMSGINTTDFFKELDKDGNGSLDFDEVITLFYIIESGRSFMSCKGCGEFLKEVYFSCVKCFNSSTAEPFHLCCACYRNNNFQHHDRAVFVDNYILLLKQLPPKKRSRLCKKKGFKAVIEDFESELAVFGLYQFPTSF